MIIGIGIDSIEIARVRAVIQRNPLLKHRLFSAREIAQMPEDNMAASRMAAVFAGKEAVLKALGTGLAGHTWQQVEVLHGQSGAPYVCLRDQADGTARRLGIGKIHISLTHDKGRAMAFCVAEGIE